MATAPAIDAPAALVPASNNAAAAVVLFDQGKFDAFYAKLKAEIDAVPIDLTTDKGRKAIASVAAKVRSEKAGIDRDRKRLTQEWRDNTALVNNAWKGIEAKLDTLAVAARKPLTDWEEAEKVRADAIERLIADIHIAAIIAPEDTAATVRGRGAMVWHIAINAEQFGDRIEEAKAAKAQAVEALKAALARLTKEEEDKAELARLRAEAAERDRLEAERAAEEHRKAREAEATRIAEERRVAAEKAEADRIARAQQEAEDRAKCEAEAAAQAERDRVQREHEAALAAERRRAEDAERARQDELDRIDREERARKAEADRVAAEQARREADEAHRAEIKAKAAGALVAIGVAERTAYRIVQAICANDIPNVRLEF